MPDVLEKLNANVAGRDAPQQVHDTNLLDFVEQWSAWVLAIRPEQ